MNKLTKISSFILAGCTVVAPSLLANVDLTNLPVVMVTPGNQLVRPAPTPQLPAAPGTGYSITPNCPTLATGVTHTATGAVTGGQFCYHFEVTANAKTTVKVTGQSAATDIQLTVQRHEADASLKAVATSANAGPADEVAGVLTAPGHYYWIMDVAATDGTDFNFSASSSPRFDAFEPNDTLAEATVLGDKLHTLTGNSDSPDDVDYFTFTAQRGQDLTLWLNDRALPQGWQLEHYNAGWQELQPRQYYSISGQVAAQQTYLRVRPKAGVVVNPGLRYELQLGSKPVKMASHAVTGEAGLTRIPYSAVPYNLTTQFYRVLKWTATVHDSKGFPVEGAMVNFMYDNDHDGSTSLTPDNLVNYPALTSSKGVAAGTLNLGKCYGSKTTTHTVSSGGYKNTWRSEYNPAAWKLLADADKTFGVGGDKVVVLTGHICAQTLISSVKG